MALGLPFTTCGILAAEDYFFQNALRLRLVNRAMHLIPVTRYRRRPHEILSMIDDCAAFLRQRGRAILAYPEGTRSSSGGVASFKRGAAVLALKLDLPVLPIFVSGTDLVLPKACIFPRRGRITVHVGSLQHWTLTKRQNLKSESLRFAQRIESEIRTLGIGSAAAKKNL